MHFPRPWLFIEHLELGSCRGISASQFEGHIVHKHLIAQLLQGGPQYDRFVQKTAKYDAALDSEVGGGVLLTEGVALNEEDGIEDVQHRAIEPEKTIAPKALTLDDKYPRLPSPHGGNEPDGLASGVERLALNDKGKAPATNTLPDLQPAQPQYSSWDRKGPTPAESARRDVVASGLKSTQVKVWGDRNGKTISQALFPDAKPTPPLLDVSIANNTNTELSNAKVINIMKTRFWDPFSPDWMPERFYDSAANKYHCPFPCE